MDSTTRTSSWGHVTGAVSGLTLLLCLLVTAFAWPAANTAPRDVPLGVAGPAPLAEQAGQRLAEAVGGESFDLTLLPDRAAAVTAIEDREIYGAVVLGPDGAEMLTASAASPVVAQILGEVAQRLPAGEAGAARVTDVVPLPPDDPRGAGLAAGALPLVLAGIAAAAVLTLRVRGSGRRIAGALGFAVAGGLAMTAILRFWLGSLSGDFWGTSTVVALGIGATATVILGLDRLLGSAGLGLGAAVMLLLGNPLSGMTSAPELLPSGWGTVGQLLPPGATGTAVRSVAFFDGAGGGSALVVLACWLAAGLVLLLVPVPGREAAPAAEPQPA